MSHEQEVQQCTDKFSWLPVILLLPRASSEKSLPISEHVSLSRLSLHSFLQACSVDVTVFRDRQLSCHHKQKLCGSWEWEEFHGVGVSHVVVWSKIRHPQLYPLAKKNTSADTYAHFCITENIPGCRAAKKKKKEVLWGMKIYNMHINTWICFCLYQCVFGLNKPVDVRRSLTKKDAVCMHLLLSMRRMHLKSMLFGFSPQL